MYASDLTHRKRAAAVFRNLQLQKEWFATGGTIRILGQKGGNDYSYMTQVEEGCIKDQCWKLYATLYAKAGNSQEQVDLASMVQLNLDASGNNGIYDYGYGPLPAARVIPTSAGNVSVFDDASIKIPMGGMDFFFSGVNYGGTNNRVYWNTNAAITFGVGIYEEEVSIDTRRDAPAILIANYDRLTSKFAHSNYSVQNGMFAVTKIVVSVSNYYADTTNLFAGQYQIRMIKEHAGEQRQWVEVTVVKADGLHPGYSNNPTVTYESGTQKDASGNFTIQQDSTGTAIDATKASPWNIKTAGPGPSNRFLNPFGSMFSTAHPPAGTTILFESDKQGNVWKASVNAYLNAY